jgi:hypothetical protein
MQAFPPRRQAAPGRLKKIAPCDIIHRPTQSFRFVAMGKVPGGSTEETPSDRATALNKQTSMGRVKLPRARHAQLSVA